MSYSPYALFACFLSGMGMGGGGGGFGAVQGHINPAFMQGGQGVNTPDGPRKRFRPDGS